MAQPEEPRRNHGEEPHLKGLEVFIAFNSRRKSASGSWLLHLWRHTTRWRGVCPFFWWGVGERGWKEMMRRSYQKKNGFCYLNCKMWKPTRIFYNPISFQFHWTLPVRRNHQFLGLMGFNEVKVSKPESPASAHIYWKHRLVPPVTDAMFFSATRLAKIGCFEPHRLRVFGELATKGSWQTCPKREPKRLLFFG